MDREKEKQAEYNQRKDIDVSELGIKEGELATLKELDHMYGGSTTQKELEEMEQEEHDRIVDPYLKKKKRFVKA